jgi:hypothetical protein
MSRVLRFVVFALVTPLTIGGAAYGVSSVIWQPKPAGEAVQQSAAATSLASEDAQYSMIAGKADRQDAKAPVSFDRGGWTTVDLAGKAGVKSVALSTLEDSDLEFPAVTKATGKSKAASVSRTKKKVVSSKKKSKKKRDTDFVENSEPVVASPRQEEGDIQLLPRPVKDADKETKNKEIKPVSEEPGKVIQNFGQSELDNHVRRK